MNPQEKPPLLQVEELRVAFHTPAGVVKAVNGVSYTLERGEVMGVVGESGSGKSMEAYAILGLIPSPGKVTGGAIRLDGEDVLAMTEREKTALRGGRAAMIFQNPMTSLNRSTPSAISSWRPSVPTTDRSAGRRLPGGPWTCWSGWASTMWRSG